MKMEAAMGVMPTDARSRRQLEEAGSGPAPPIPSLLQHGSPPVKNRAAQQEVSGRGASEASSAAPHRSHYRLDHHPNPAPVRGKIVFHETGPWCQKGWGPLFYNVT